MSEEPTPTPSATETPAPVIKKAKREKPEGKGQWAFSGRALGAMSRGKPYTRHGAAPKGSEHNKLRSRNQPKPMGQERFPFGKYFDSDTKWARPSPKNPLVPADLTQIDSRIPVFAAYIPSKPGVY